MELPRVEPGQPITADAWNALIDAANQCNLTVADNSGLTLFEDEDGYVLGSAILTYYWAITTGPISGGTYPFTQQWPAASGTWTAGALSDDAYETTGNTTVPTGTYIKVWETVAGDWRFRAPTC